MASNGVRMALQISPLQCRQGKDSDVGGKHKTNVYAASSDCVVDLVLGDPVT
jgi:hypothetical protein